jgi:hypothetical protein
VAAFGLIAYFGMKAVIKIEATETRLFLVIVIFCVAFAAATLLALVRDTSERWSRSCPMTASSEALQTALERRDTLQRELDERISAPDSAPLSDAETAEFWARLETNARSVLDCARPT